MSENNNNNTIDLLGCYNSFTADKLEGILNNKDNYNHIDQENITIMSYKKADGTYDCIPLFPNRVQTSEEQANFCIDTDGHTAFETQEQLLEYAINWAIGGKQENEEIKILDYTHGNKDYKGAVNQGQKEGYDIIIYNFNESTKRLAPDLKEIERRTLESSVVYNAIMDKLNKSAIKKNITFSGTSMGVPYALSKMKNIDKSKIKGDSDNYEINISLDSIPSFAGYIADPYEDTAKLFVEGISGNNGEFYDKINKICIKKNLGGIYHTKSDTENFLRGVYRSFQINDNIKSDDFEEFKNKVFISGETDILDIKNKLNEEYKKDDNDIGNRDKKIEDTKLIGKNKTKFILILVLLALSLVGIIFIFKVKKKMKQKQFEQDEERAKFLNIKNNSIPKNSLDDITKTTDLDATGIT